MLHKKEKIRVTPQEEAPIASMIDVVFLLLCFFIITSNPINDEAHVSIKLLGQGGTGDPPPTIDIYVLSESKNINAKGKFIYQINNAEYPPQKIEKFISKFTADPEQAQNARVNIKVAPDAKHKRVIELVDILNKHSLEKFNISSLK